MTSSNPPFLVTLFTLVESYITKRYPNLEADYSIVQDSIKDICERQNLLENSQNALAQQLSEMNHRFDQQAANDAQDRADMRLATSSTIADLEAAKEDQLAMHQEISALGADTQAEASRIDAAFNDLSQRYKQSRAQMDKMVADAAAVSRDIASERNRISERDASSATLTNEVAKLGSAQKSTDAALRTLEARHDERDASITALRSDVHGLLGPIRDRLATLEKQRLPPRGSTVYAKDKSIELPETNPPSSAHEQSSETEDEDATVSLPREPTSEQPHAHPSLHHEQRPVYASSPTSSQAARLREQVAIPETMMPEDDDEDDEDDELLPSMVGDEHASSGVDEQPHGSEHPNENLAAHPAEAIAVSSRMSSPEAPIPSGLLDGAPLIPPMPVFPNSPTGLHPPKQSNVVQEATTSSTLAAESPPTNQTSNGNAQGKKRKARSRMNNVSPTRGRKKAKSHNVPDPKPCSTKRAVGDENKENIPPKGSINQTTSSRGRSSARTVTGSIGPRRALRDKPRSDYNIENQMKAQFKRR